MSIETRTQCLIPHLSITAFASYPLFRASSSHRRRIGKGLLIYEPPSSSSSSSTRMSLYTLIYISLAVITLFLSPSAYADGGCTPIVILADGDREEEGPPVLSNSGEDLKNEVFVREGTSFIMTCELSRFHNLKWTLNSREITPQLQDEWEVHIETESESPDGHVYSKLEVSNASTKYHPGEYKCTPVCLNKEVGANVGVKVVVTIGLNVTLDATIAYESLYEHRPLYKKYVTREKWTEVTCTAHVPGAAVNWYRLDDNKKPEDMMTVCERTDVEVSVKVKKRPRHCEIQRTNSESSTSARLFIKRVRKEGNSTLQTISDFRLYFCNASRGKDLSAKIYLKLLEKMAVGRNLHHKGGSLTVTEGDGLQLYCDIFGMDDELEDGNSVHVKWLKDGKEFRPDEISNKYKEMKGINKSEKGHPFRHGYDFEMADRLHRGHYTCQVLKGGVKFLVAQGESAEGDDEFTYYVRVKDKLGALWPFLGICGEIVILFAIIIIYEKRKSKAELEESDTDGSPDQNNSNSNSND